MPDAYDDLGVVGYQGVDLEQLGADVLHPALHAVFVAVAVGSVALLISGLVMPRRIAEPEADGLSSHHTD